MRKIIVVLIIILSIGKLYADAGNCVKYQLGITLLDDSYTEGFVFNNSYQAEYEFKNITIKDFIIKNCINQENKLIVYLNVLTLAFPKLSDFTQDCDFHLNATSLENLKTIDLQDIKEIKLVEFNICHNCDKFDITDGFYWVGIYPNVITELTNKEIDLLQTEPFSIHSFYYPIDETSLFEVISYNKLVDAEALKKLCDDFLHALKPEFDKNNWEEINNKYTSFKEVLRSQNVIVFKIGFMM
ncbi:MAG: hypothetical protein K0B10_05055 [Vicingaceae bacterium]|nr:hypothetical protein [Vicingaceae bacterium]